MKFHQLSMGQRFEFEGEVYVRTKPMIAVNEADGSPRFIRRSAAVRVLGHEAPEPPPEPPVDNTRELDREAVLEAFDAFYARCLLGLDELGADIDRERMAQVRDTIRVARQRFLESLAL